MRKFVAKIAILCVLAQAGIAAWHISTMFAANALAGSDAQAAMSCHAPDAAESTSAGKTGDDGTLLSHEDCTCCQVIVAGGPLPMAANALPRPSMRTVSFAALVESARFGGHPLAADSRAPPARA